LLNMFRATLCPSSGAQEYYTVVAACGISCCKNVENNFVIFCGICVPQISQKLTKLFFYIFTARNTTGSNHCIILLSS